MEANDVKSVSTEVSTKMKTAIEHLRRELVGVRTGRASIAILDRSISTRTARACP